MVLCLMLMMYNQQAGSRSPIEGGGADKGHILDRDSKGVLGTPYGMQFYFFSQIKL